MKRRNKKKTGLNPYIILADVLIATLVVLVLLLFSMASQLEETSAALGEYQAQETNRKALEETIAGRNKALQDDLEEAFGGKNKKFGIKFAQGPTTFLIRIHGSNLWPKGRSDLAPGLVPRMNQVVQKISETCDDNRAQDVAPLIEVRVEGHCKQANRKSIYSEEEGREIDRRLLQKSISRAREIQGKFDPDLHYLISVSGFGANRPAYDSSWGAIHKALDDTELKAKIAPLAKGSSEVANLTEADNRKLQKYLDQPKSVIEDRVDIILVYAGLNRDNDFVYPRSVLTNKEPPEWMNDVSWPRVHANYLKGLMKNEAKND